ncbi:MAG: radical SAM protein [Clostridia bacterium]|nr:radical SAM protein [Clostridia bacterium]
MAKEIILGNTESVCPQCLKRIPAQKVIVGADVYLTKECPEHGKFRVLIWKGSEPPYADWANTKVPAAPKVCLTKVEQGCPFDCGLCPEHRRDTCCLLLEVTKGCNLHCPICFADADKACDSDPDLQEIESWYKSLSENGLPYNIQISGGEPTVRDDLPQIIKLGRKYGFSYIQLNTNGLRMGREPRFVKQLKEAGLSSVFLQFDGTNDEIYKQIRGKALLDVKTAAVENCAKEGIGVVLVPTLVPGVNMDNIGEIINFAVSCMPAVRGVHFQPISYFGRYPMSPPETRITIPEILRAIENQTNGKIKAANFLPPGAENAYCSFHGNFILTEEGELKPWNSLQSGKSCCQPIDAREGVNKSRDFVARQWAGPGNPTLENGCGCSCPNQIDELSEINVDSLDRFLTRVRDFTLAISGMAFQDAWSLDLDRLRDCIVHVFSADKRIIPFCAYNLTAQNGNSLYRK